MPFDDFGNCLDHSRYACGTCTQADRLAAEDRARTQIVAGLELRKVEALERIAAELAWQRAHWELKR